MAAADPAGCALAFDEAKRALDEQERVVAELRSRAGTLIAAAAITTSFRGGRILSPHHLHPLAWAAIGCFAFVGITLLALLWPWRDWRFTVNAQSFIQTYLEPPGAAPLDVPAIQRDLAPAGRDLRAARFVTDAEQDSATGRTLPARLGAGIRPSVPAPRPFITCRPGGSRAPIWLSSPCRLDRRAGGRCDAQHARYGPREPPVPASEQ